MFTNIKLFSYIRPVKCNVQILNGSKYTSKSFGLVIIKKPKTNIIIQLWPPYYITQNPQNIISQNALKNYNKLRKVGTEDLRWVQMTTYIGVKLKVDTLAKEIDQQLLDFITIDILKLEH